jgi:hypothetical protein
MRAVPALSCSDNLNPDGILAIVRYQNDDCTSDGSCTAEPESTPFNISSMECKDETGLVPIVPKNVGALTSGDELDIDAIQNNSIQDTYFKFTINGSSLFIDWGNPTLLMAENLDPSFPNDYNVISLNGTSETVYIHPTNVANDSGHILFFNL